ncbi:hypothetical protein [Xanthomonas hyacinthi]|uniref:hypothetical protein n=1 Tax=Xanthomonas hyacinthi TaxID=56455 RepID=UPI001FCB15CD|nr:hypothetical protein [Xanthomonas hyacinthi]
MSTPATRLREQLQLLPGLAPIDGVLVQRAPAAVPFERQYLAVRQQAGRVC